MTAATSAGSTFLSRACWRMMSSWRSGSWISCTACSNTGRSSRKPRMPRPSTASAVLRRRRRTAALRRARGRARVAEERRAVAAGRTLIRSACQGSPTGSSRGPRANRDCPQRGSRACAFSSAESWRAARSSSAACPRAAGALEPQRLVGVDHDRRVEGALQAGLEEQRHLDDQRPRRGRARGRPPRASAPSRRRRAARSRPRATRAPSSLANACRATAARSTTPPGATSSPQRATTRSRISSLA